MRTADFSFDLPDELIAQQPSGRGQARMLVFDRHSGHLEHTCVTEFPAYLAEGDLLLINNTRVIAARLWGRRSTGRRFEMLLLEQRDDSRWQALLRPSSRARVGERLALADGGAAIPETRLGDGQWLIRFDPELGIERLDEIGETPLPPYISRPEGATQVDREAYQTVYAATPGAVAAPTAGLHFTDEMLANVRNRGVEVVETTLHVGIGTFRPVSAELVADHRMHRERFAFSAEAAQSLNSAIADHRRIVCVGTTSVRALEGALQKGEIGPGWDDTEIFITPGFKFRATGAMLTNFHLPKSTLLMMISAFAGRERILEVYREAVREGYRFFSYGDATLIL